MTSKSEIRNKMRTKRKSLSAAQKMCISQKISCALGCDPAIVAAKTGESIFAVYLASPAEIDLTPFIRETLARGIKIAAPRWNGQSYDLAELRELSEACLRKGPMGILEPAEGNIIEPKDVSVWIVPGLAFTADGHRLGYGGGWYDRLLADARSDAAKIGVACTFQIVENLPDESHDIRLDRIVSDCPL